MQDMHPSKFGCQTLSLEVMLKLLMQEMQSFMKILAIQQGQCALPQLPYS